MTFNFFIVIIPLNLKFYLSLNNTIVFSYYILNIGGIMKEITFSEKEISQIDLNNECCYTQGKNGKRKHFTKETLETINN